MIPWTPFLAGIAAGLGIALPLGAIGVLIVREGVERGLRAGSAAALAVACVDLGYALLAVVVGERIAGALSGVERVVQVVGAVALGAVVVIGVRDLVRSLRVAEVPESSALPVLPVGTGRTYLRFLGLTAINPMTAVYFVALTSGLSQRLSGPGAGVAFATGVFLGSLAWQLALAIGGATAGSRMSHRVRIAVSLAGYAIVAGYAVKLAVGA